MDPICRACLDSKKILISADSNLLDNFNSLTNLHATLSDDKPQFFCFTCYKYIQQFAQFREKCIESEKTLEGIITQTKESILLKIKIEDEIKYSDEEMGLDKNDEVTIESEVQTDKKIMRKSTRIVKNMNTKGMNIKTKAKKIISVKKKTKQIFMDIDVLRCGICTETFSRVDKEKLNLHIDSHKNDNQCTICKEYFTEWPAVLGHRVMHLQRKHKNCHICQKYYASESGMEYHYRNVHFEGMQKALTCKLCTKVFDTPRKLQRHIQWMHLPSNNVFKCDICPKICKSRQTLSSHLKVHSDRKDYFCDDCGFSCKALGTLSYHIRRVHLKMAYCTFCEKPFKNQQILAEHKSMCTDSFTLCPVCGKKVLKKRLKKHMATHSDVCKYKCTRCPAAFKTKLSLSSHIDRHEGKKRYHCQFCSLKFYSYSSLIKHRRIHTGEKPYKCKVCNKAFTGGNNLKVHMKVHGEYLIKKKSIEPKNSSQN